jgi:PIN domain nuclease of toxin-antitoxin system
MRVLLDSHVLLWALGSERSLSAEAREVIGDAANVVSASIVSLWEIKIKESLGKLKLPKGFYKAIEPAGFEILPLTLAHVQALDKLPMHHRDPFDRLLIAQAKTEQMLLVTHDAEFKRYKANLLLT